MGLVRLGFHCNSTCKQPDKVKTHIKPLESPLKQHTHPEHLYEALKLPEKALSNYSQAISIFKEHFPHYAQCLNNLANLYQSMHQPALAENQYTQAFALYSTHYPQHINLAYCFKNYGELLSKQGRGAEAVDRIVKARAIFGINHYRDEVVHCEALLQGVTLK